MNDVINLLNDKNVLLVGNGSSVLKHDYSKDIDSYEFVIRFNYGIQEFHKFPNAGQKVDAWFYTIRSPKTCIRVYNKTQIKAKHCIRHANDPVNIGEYQYHIPGDFREKLNKSLIYPKNKLASSGLCAIHYLVDYCTTKSITLVGFDSFDTGNYYNGKNLAYKWHPANIEKVYINNLIEKNKISTLDI